MQLSEPTVLLVARMAPVVFRRRRSGAAGRSQGCRGAPAPAGVVKPYHGHGISLRPEHFQSALEGPLPVPWVEVMSEPYMGALGGLRRAVLEKVRREGPVALHSTTLSIGSTDPLDLDFVRGLRTMAERIDAAWVSDHLAWSSLGGRDLDLLPLPYTEECLDHVVQRVEAVQDVLGPIPLLLENPASYLEFTTSTMRESEFLAAVAERSGCRILLDVNNLEVSAGNSGFDPLAYLDDLPAALVWQIHLAGHQPSRPPAT